MEIFELSAANAATLELAKRAWWKEINTRQNSPLMDGPYFLALIAERAFQLQYIDTDGFMWRCIAIIKLAVDLSAVAATHELIRRFNLSDNSIRALVDGRIAGEFYGKASA